MTARRVLGALVAGALTAATMAAPAHAATAAHSEVLLFDGGGSEVLNGITYHSFRIPSLIRTKADTLIAFAEGRASSNADYGNINLIYKRSTDNGATWGALSEVVGSGQGTWGNPTAVVDQNTGKIFLFLSSNPAGYSQSGAAGTTAISQWGDRRTWLSTSTDDGLTWSTPVDMTATLTPHTKADGVTPWAWDAVGPGVGIQLTFGAHAGRLVIPAIGRDIYSDDDGATWQYELLKKADGTRVEGTNESMILEAMDGTLYRSDRPDNPTATQHYRWVTRGTIEGGFTDYVVDGHLPDPICQASLLRYNASAPARMEFLNSNATDTRTKMAIRISYDDGHTWKYSRPLSDAPLPAWSGLGTGTVKEGGYSSMAKTADFFTGMLVEVNEDTASNSTSHRSIVFRKVNLPWILNGQTESP
ncbi:sialidase family protein [Hamadaea tsunoensis]|uniref:sialidase family protein n=1 Tax=Hamadaea tsunoensis TaxID=53368 RepID=UPI0012F9217A|nr:sialidase family protein [Hamadaea tsunoensis]